MSAIDWYARAREAEKLQEEQSRILHEIAGIVGDVPHCDGAALLDRARAIMRDLLILRQSEKQWRRIAVQAMRYLDRAQLQAVAAQAGANITLCGGDGSDAISDPSRRPFDIQAAIFLAGACDRRIMLSMLDARSEIGDALLDFASGLYGDREPLGDLRREYQTLQARRSASRR